MEIYRAVSDFTPPSVEGSENILSFEKGHRFEIFDCHKTGTEWWGARALTNDAVGYVPSRYMEYEERKIGRLLSEDYESQREESLRKFTNMQNATNHQTPDDQYLDVAEPEPDYDDDAPGTPPDSTCMSELQSRLEPVIMRDRQSSRSDRPPSDSDESALIHPKRLANPCMDSKPRMDLHKELLMNYKMGKNVLEKPELNKVLEERKERQKKQEWVQRESTKRTSLELKLEQMSRKVSEVSPGMKPISEIENEDKNSELSKVHAKILNKNGSVK